MDKLLVKKLHLKLEPIGIFFGNTTTKCDLDVLPNKHNCVIPFLMSSAKGKTISMDDKSCNCPGGATGCCFGDGFSRINPNIHKMLSQGYGENIPEGLPEDFKDGERFFCSEEVALKWRNSLPFSEKGYPRIVFAPLSRWNEIGSPDLVYIFANPDQISALVTLLGFHNGRAINTIVPFGSACQSIMYAADQIESDNPQAIMGLFDISQRLSSLANYLSMTMPYALWEQITKDLDKSFFTTNSWHKIEKRL